MDPYSYHFLEIFLSLSPFLPLINICASNWVYAHISEHTYSYA